MPVVLLCPPVVGSARGGRGDGGSPPGWAPNRRDGISGSRSTTATSECAVSDRRGIEVKSGQSSFELADVPALIDPTSVHLKAPGGELSVLEQNFQYDLAGYGVLQRYLDANVKRSWERETEVRLQSSALTVGPWCSAGATGR